MRSRLLLFYTVAVFMWIAIYGYIPYVAPYGEVLGADFRMIGIIAGAYGFTQMLVRFPLGILSDKLRMRKIFIILGLFFAKLSGLVVYVFPTPGALLASRTLAGVAVSSWVIFMILGASYYTREETTKSVGYLNAMNALGRMIALLGGGFAAESMGFSYAFLFSGVAGVIGLALSFFLVEKKPDMAGSTKDGFKKPLTIKALLGVARNRQLLSASILCILVQYIPFATTFGFIPVAATRLGAGNMMLGVLGFVTLFPALLVSPLAGTVLPRKLGVKYTLVISFLLTGLGVAAVPFCQSLWQLFAVQLISNTGTAIGLTLLMGLCIQDISGEQRGTAMGFFQAVYGFGMFLGPFVMGWISHSVGLTEAFLFTGAIGAVGAIASVIYVNKGYLRYIY